MFMNISMKKREKELCQAAFGAVSLCPELITA